MRGVAARGGVVLVILMWSLSGPAAPGEETGSGPDVNVRVRSSIQTCALGRACLIKTNYGSGTIIGRWWGQWAVLTCCHTLFRGGRHTVDVGDSRYEAEWIAAEPRDDLAVLVFRCELPLPRAMLAPRRTACGLSLTTGGFPDGGALLQRRTRLLRRTGERQDLVLDVPIRVGESGGGVFEAGELVGVMWGTDPRRGESLAVSVERVHAFLKRRNVLLDAPEPNAPVPEEEARSPPEDRSGCGQEVERLNQRLANLEEAGRKELERLRREMAAIRVRAGPKGEKGDRGPPGRDADGEELKREMGELRERLRKLEASIIVEVTPIP